MPGKPIRRSEGARRPGPADQSSALLDASVRAAFEHVGCVVFCLDVDHHVLEWNDAMVRLTGQPRAEAVGVDFVAAFVPEAERRVATIQFQCILDGKQNEIYEGTIQTREFDQRRILCDLTRLDSDEGRPVAVLAIGHDITERKRAEALQEGQSRVLELIATGAELRTALDQLVDTIEAQAPGMLCSILTYDAAHRCLRHGTAPHLPPAYCAAVDGVAIGPAMGSCGTAAYRRERVIVERIATDPLWQEFRGLAQEHGLQACWSQPILSSHGDVLGTFAMYYRRPRGPTEFELELIEKAASLAGIALERDRVEVERQQLQTQMLRTQKMESLGILAGGVAHDFNNLLVGVLGNADLLQEQVFPDAAVVESIEEIRDAGRRAAELCRQLLAYAGKGSFTFERVDINQVVRDVVRLLKASIPPEAELEYRFQERLPAIEIDRSQIHQVIMNLVTNAAEALEGDGGTVVISTGTADAGERVFVEVADDGCGMDAATAERIFDPFFTTKPTGHGLGLAAVDGIVRAHHGTIDVTSTPTAGTSFRVWLPAAGPIGTEAVAADTEPPPRGEGTILVVDDEAAARAVARRMLDRAGFSALTAASGAEAIELFGLHTGDIRAVILDLKMPHMGGAATFRELRRLRADVPVLVCSGYGELDAVHDFVDQPGVRFLQKPYELEQLRDMLGALLA